MKAFKFILALLFAFNLHGMKRNENETINISQPISSQKAAISSASLEKPEEIQFNKLFIILDVEDYNTSGQPIFWQRAVSAAKSKVKEIDGAYFLPVNDFHISLMWYESKKAITPELVAKVEHALMHASQILKIVFPDGITGLSLIDGPILLGKSKDSVVFKVTESVDLKKLQDILLKFLSFENVEELFKFNTFEKENPLHATLGRIAPAKASTALQNTLIKLDAPEGARASLNQSFTIETLRLAYSFHGKKGTKMVYKF